MTSDELKVVLETQQELARIERLERIELAARVLVEAYDHVRDRAYPYPALVQVTAQVDQLRSALEGRASSYSPAPGGGDPAG